MAVAEWLAEQMRAVAAEIRVDDARPHKAKVTPADALDRLASRIESGL